MPKPSPGTPLNTGHAHAANLISCLPLLEGTGSPSDLSRTTTYSALPLHLNWVTSGNTQYDPCLQSIGIGGGSTSMTDTHTPPMTGRSSAWAFLIGIQFLTLAGPGRYVYQERLSASGDGFSLIWEFTNDLFQIFTSEGSGDFMTNNGVVIPNTGWHVVGWSYAGPGGEYAKWLDGVKTTINSSITLTCGTGWNITVFPGRPTEDGPDVNISFIFEWASVPDIAAISADPWAMFAPAVTAPGSTYVLFEG